MNCLGACRTNCNTRSVGFRYIVPVHNACVSKKSRLSFHESYLIALTLYAFPFSVWNVVT
jgi:hypothetical protein